MPVPRPPRTLDFCILAWLRPTHYTPHPPAAPSQLRGRGCLSGPCVPGAQGRLFFFLLVPLGAKVKVQRSYLGPCSTPTTTLTVGLGVLEVAGQGSPARCSPRLQEVGCLRPTVSLPLPPVEEPETAWENRELATSVNIISIQESKHCDGISTDIGDACTNQTLIGDTDFRVKSRSAVEHGTGGGQGGSKGGRGDARGRV